MAKTKAVVKAFTPKGKKSRKGIVAKSKTSKLKSSKLYKKAYRGQGK